MHSSTQAPSADTITLNADVLRDLLKIEDDGERLTEERVYERVDALLAALDDADGDFEAEDSEASRIRHGDHPRVELGTAGDGRPVAKVTLLHPVTHGSETITEVTVRLLELHEVSRIGAAKKSERAAETIARMCSRTTNELRKLADVDLKTIGAAKTAISGKA